MPRTIVIPDAPPIPFDWREAEIFDLTFFSKTLFSIALDAPYWVDGEVYPFTESVIGERDDPVVRAVLACVGASDVSLDLIRKRLRLLHQGYTWLGFAPIRSPLPASVGEAVCIGGSLDGVIVPHSLDGLSVLLAVPGRDQVPGRPRNVIERYSCVAGRREIRLRSLQVKA